MGWRGDLLHERRKSAMVDITKVAEVGKVFASARSDVTTATRPFFAGGRRNPCKNMQLPPSIACATFQTERDVILNVEDGAYENVARFLLPCPGFFSEPT